MSAKKIHQLCVYNTLSLTHSLAEWVHREIRTGRKVHSPNCLHAAKETRTNHTMEWKENYSGTKMKEIKRILNLFAIINDYKSDCICTQSSEEICFTKSTKRRSMPLIKETNTHTHTLFSFGMAGQAMLNWWKADHCTRFALGSASHTEKIGQFSVYALSAEGS